VYYYEEFQATSIGEMNHGIVLDLSGPPSGREDVDQFTPDNQPKWALGRSSRLCADGRLGDMLDVIKYSMKYIFQQRPGLLDRYLAHLSSNFS
jgi:hypothetical protein